VSLSGDTLAVGAYGESSSATGINGDQADNSAYQSGAVYVFTRSGTTWTQQAYIKASNTGAGDYFGSSVSLSGDTLAVGAYGESSSATAIDGDQADNSAYQSGAVYVFTRSGTAWTQQAYIKASNAGAEHQFGSSISLSGDTLAVAPGPWIYTRSGTTWTQQAYLHAGSGMVSLSGDTIAVGGVAAQMGHYIRYSLNMFTRSGTTWTQQAHGEWEGGLAVSLSGDTLAVGKAGNEAVEVFTGLEAATLRSP
jgi:hypothetical protein